MCLLALFSSKPCPSKILATKLEIQTTRTCMRMLKQRYTTEVLYHQKMISVFQTKALTIQVPNCPWAVTCSWQNSCIRKMTYRLTKLRQTELVFGL